MGFAWRCRSPAHLDIRTPAQLRAFRLASRSAYAPLLETGRRNSDYFPFLEYGAARARFLRRNDANLIQLARDPVPALETLSGFEPPSLAEDSAQGANTLPRFLDIERANLIAGALSGVRADAPPATLSDADAMNVQRILNPRAGMAAESWNEWFSALFSLSKPMTPNGGSRALAHFLGAENVAGSLRSAPPDIRAKVDFLLRVGERDLDRIRALGARLLAGPIHETDPAGTRRGIANRAKVRLDLVHILQRSRWNP